MVRIPDNLKALTVVLLSSFRFVCHMGVRGMRAIKSVLVVAGGFKRADPSLTEQVRGCLKGWTSCSNLKGELIRLSMFPFKAIKIY